MTGSRSTFHLSISSKERRWLLILLDLAGINGGLLLSLGFRPDYELTWSLVLSNVIWFVLLSGTWMAAGYIFQVYDLQRAGHAETALKSILGAGIAALLVYNFIPYLPPALPPSRQPFFVTLLAPLGLLVLGRLTYLALFSQVDLRRRLLIVGAGWAGNTILQALCDHGLTLYDPVGFLDDDPEKIGRLIEIPGKEKSKERSERTRLPVLGNTQDLPAVIEEEQIAVVVIAITHGVSGHLLRVFTDSLQQGVDVVPMPLLYEQLTGKVPVEHIGEHWAVSMPLEHPGTKTFRIASKRVFDLFWSILGLSFLILAFPFLALAIYLDSPGPILYKQQRLGKNGRLFQVYKFRSMIPNAEGGSAVWAQEDDPRVTRVGRFLRKTHLDEFPQFVNIIKGEMSVVGPRPERPEFIDELVDQIPFYRVRLVVKPGMAGWGLIHQGYGSSLEDTLEKFQYDLYYIKHHNLWMDFYVLMQTFWDAVSLKGT